jgi:hypothetical protein
LLLLQGRRDLLIVRVGRLLGWVRVLRRRRRRQSCHCSRCLRVVVLRRILLGSNRTVLTLPYTAVVILRGRRWLLLLQGRQGLLIGLLLLRWCPVRLLQVGQGLLVELLRWRLLLLLLPPVVWLRLLL